MIGVFVTFIRVVYGRMIYMSVPGCYITSVVPLFCFPTLTIKEYKIFILFFFIYIFFLIF